MCWVPRGAGRAAGALDGRAMDFAKPGDLRSNGFEPKGDLSRCQSFPSRTFRTGLDL